MAFWYPTDDRLGIQPIAVSVTSGQAVSGAVKNHQLGEVVRAIDTLSGNGGGEFIFLKGVGSTVVGSLVKYDPLNGTTTLLVNTANQACPVAVAMSANNATTTYGWYQISGVAQIKKTAVKINPAVALFISATAGRVKAVASAGLQLLNCQTVNAATVASATSTIKAVIDRPFAQGQVT